MRVALDGSFLSLPPSGIGTYLRHLADALRDLDSSLDLRIVEPNWHDVSRDDRTRTLPSRLWHDRRVQRFAWDLVGVERQSSRLAPDLLHVPHFAAPLRPRAPLIVTVHDVIPLVLPAYRSSQAMRANLAIMRRTVRRAQVILTPSTAAAADVSRMLAITPDRIRVTPEAAGALFRPSDDPASDRAVAQRFGVAGPYIFNVGGYDARKNLPVLLEAFARCRGEIDLSTKLVIAGAPHSDNPAVFPPLPPLIERLGLAGAVVLTGRVSELDKVALYRGAALYATPSLYEGFGLTALEAMACGVPTIAADRASLPEVVGDGGMLVEPDAESFARAITRVLNDPHLSGNLRERGLRRAATFSWRRTAQLTLSAYHDVMESTTKARRKRTH